MNTVDNSAPIQNDGAQVAPTPLETENKPAPTAGPADTAAGEQPPADGQPPKPRDRSAEKRISKLTQKYEAAQREIGRMQGLLEAKAPQPSGPDPTARPEASQFTKYEDYIEALTDWKTEQKLTQRETSTRERASRGEAIQAEAQRSKAVLDKLAAAGKDIEGFDEVIETITSDDFRVSRTMRDYLGEAEHAAPLAQWLAENPKEAARIADMDPAVAVRALEKAEARLGAKAPPRTTNAPPPVPTVGGRSTANFDPNKASMDDYAVYWKQRQKA